MSNVTRIIDYLADQLREIAPPPGKKFPAHRSAIARDLRTPKYRPRVVRDRTRYTRKRKHHNDN